jgi:hypothetical protein
MLRLRQSLGSPRMISLRRATTATHTEPLTMCVVPLRRSAWTVVRREVP